MHIVKPRVGVGKWQPVSKIFPAICFVIKVSLEHSQAHLFSYIYGPQRLKHLLSVPLQENLAPLPRTTTKKPKK